MSDQCPRCLCERHIGPCAGLRLGAVLLLALLACGGKAESAPEYVGGWCCDGLCELSAEQKARMHACTCNGIAKADGECEVRQ